MNVWLSHINRHLYRNVKIFTCNQFLLCEYPHFQTGASGHRVEPIGQKKKNKKKLDSKKLLKNSLTMNIISSFS